MTYEIKDLTHFSAGEVINTTDGTVMNGVLNNPDALSAEMKTFYDKTLITLAGASLIHEQFGQKRPIPKNGGKTIEFRKFSRLPKALTPITEGVTPAGNKLNVSSVSCTVDQYGDYIEQTDMLELTSVDNTIVEATKELAAQAGLTLDTVVRNELVGGTNVMYAPKRDAEGNETEILSRSDITPESRLRVKDIFKAAAQLKAVNAPKINGSYVAIIHPYVAYDLMQDAKEQWIGIQKYADPEKILKGEIGTLGGVRFVESTEAKIFSPDEFIPGVNRAVTLSDSNSDKYLKIADYCESGFTPSKQIPIYINGEPCNVVRVFIDTSSEEAKANNGRITILEIDVKKDIPAGSVICGQGATKDGSNVFCTLFLGENAYGVTDIEGGGLEHIVKQKGYGNDPLNQRSSVGWKATKVAKRLLEEYIIRVESGSEFSATAVSN